ncbi:glucose 1-dehydrogenase [Hyphomicrobium sp.]|uniref:glucose 1-dehydrogenase n=1 Tax=Hyphomicrobium sp. TaxID=82 RepID=UPI001D51DE76|nr:glucose 1-dehydrogenase [Hyphomicrobium sp.]MBY0558486.1 glucose 1-dehydrogenase [Hyphomicrobium sp.]
MDRLSGKVAIVTGAAAGIGLATAKVFAREGASVMMTDCDTVSGEAAARELARFGTVHFEQHDVASEANWRLIINATMQRFGPPNILVNNAGIQLTRGLEETTLDDWRRVFSVNAEGTFIGTRVAVESMKDRGGSIINVCSTYSMVADGLNAAYCASKAASRHFTKAAALYCADRKYNIRVNAVHPGVVMTPMLEREIAAVTADRGLPDTSAVESEWGRICPLGIGEASDIADGILYLASDESKYVTGSDLVIDGGHIIR